MIHILITENCSKVIIKELKHICHNLNIDGGGSA